MKTRCLRILLTVIIGIVFPLDCVLLAQEESDWRTWTSVVIYYKIGKSLRLRTKAEYRMNDNLSKTDRWSVNAGIHYNILSFLELKGSYEFHHRYLDDRSWKFRHRYNIGAQASWKSGDFKISWRERFQQTIQSGDVESLLRSRLKFDYNIPATLLQPHFSVETFQCLNRGTFPEVFRIRYRPGLKIGISERYYVLLFYCRQYERLRKADILGLEMELNF